jgi:hypothetical protein
MNRAILLEHLAMAERHVHEGETHLVHQRELIARLKHGGYGTLEAENLLRLMCQSQALHIADRDRLRAELERQPS